MTTKLKAVPIPNRSKKKKKKKSRHQAISIHLAPSVSFLHCHAGHHELLTLLQSGGEVDDESISLLIIADPLTWQLTDPNRFWFAIPDIGSILEDLSQEGRKELLSLLKRNKYKEMMLATLEKKRLRYSPLDMRFHLRDLIGSELLKTAETASGIVVRISKD